MKAILKILALPFIGLIKIYQWVISPILGPKCRFTPTCSQYGVEALKTHGLFKGIWLTANRVRKCHPWGGSGYDPVPPAKGTPDNEQACPTESFRRGISNKEGKQAGN